MCVCASDDELLSVARVRITVLCVCHANESVFSVLCFVLIDNKIPWAWAMANGAIVRANVLVCVRVVCAT